MRLLNLTPHELRIRNIDNDGEIYLPKSMKPARCVLNPMPVKHGFVYVDGETIELLRYHVGSVFDLPEPVEGVTYVVSAMVARAAAELGRTDVVMPGPSIRDEYYRVVACHGLQAV